MRSTGISGSIRPTSASTRSPTTATASGFRSSTWPMTPWSQPRPTVVPRCRSDITTSTNPSRRAASPSSVTSCSRTTGSPEALHKRDGRQGQAGQSRPAPDGRRELRHQPSAERDGIRRDERRQQQEQDADPVRRNHLQRAPRRVEPAGIQKPGQRIAGGERHRRPFEHAARTMQRDPRHRRQAPENERMHARPDRQDDAEENDRFSGRAWKTACQITQPVTSPRNISSRPRVPPGWR